METTQRNLASASSFAQCGVRLNTGAWMPAPAYGTWNVRGSAGRVALDEALAAGYRHLDTANMYSNERDVGAVLRSHPDLHPDAAVPSPSSSSPSSSSIFVTTKFTGHGYAHAKAACELALKELGVASIDLFLIHWPGQGDEAARRESWRALEELYAAGKCRAIGVSNYTEHHLRQLLAHAKVVPAVNEVAPPSVRVVSHVRRCVRCVCLLTPHVRAIHTSSSSIRIWCRRSWYSSATRTESR
jgi:2,5-diketo-D-gluconate reductase A